MRPLQGRGAPSKLARLVFCTLVLAASFVAVTARPAHAGDGRFHVVGRNIVGPDGNVVVLRGVNKSGLEYTPWGYDFNQATFQKMKSWGVNAVRIPLAPSFAVDAMCGFRATYWSTIDTVVAYAESLGMLVILDDHFATRGSQCGVKADNQKAPDVYNLRFVEMLATRYRNHPYVAIDLYNEPHGISWSVWRNGGEVDGYRAVGMQQLLDGVRGAGFPHLVFASGNDWANDLSGIATTRLADDANVVYAAHAYPFECNGVEVPRAEPYRCDGKQYPAVLDRRVGPALATRPVMLTEFGTQRAIAGETSAPIQWAESHGVGWMTWLWCNGLVSDFCLLTPTGEPSVTGQPVREALLAAAQRGTSTTVPPQNPTPPTTVATRPKGFPVPNSATRPKRPSATSGAPRAARSLTMGIRNAG